MTIRIRLPTSEHDDRRWLWVASVAGIVLLIAVAGTLMILSGGDSGTTSATVSPSTSRPVPYPSAAPSPSASRAPSATALPPETITSVTPTPTAAPSTAPTEAAPPPAADPRTVTYQVTGSRQLLDLVTVIYTDQQGALQTDVNVALPWTKQVVLDPGVELSSVTATSVTRSAQLRDHRRRRRDAGDAEQQLDHHELHPLSGVRPGPAPACVCCACAADGRRTRSTGPAPRCPRPPGRRVRRGRRARTGPG